jgi:hypothetical protein
MTRPAKSATKKAAAKTDAPKVAETKPDPAPTEAPAAVEAPVEAPATETTPATAASETPAAANTEVQDLLARIAELEAEKAAAATPAAAVPPAEVIQPEAPFGAAPGDLDPGEAAPAVREVVVVPGNSPEAAAAGPAAAVVFLGIKGDVIHPQAVSVIVPDGAEPDYESVVRDGTSYTLRLNQQTRVRPEHVEWLEGHPAFDIERA